MKEHQKEIIKLSARRVLLGIFDLALPVFESNKIYRTSAKRFREEIDCETSNFSERLKYLKRQGMINHIVEGKEKYIEITPKGINKIKKLQFHELSIQRTEKWDKKWRIVIFDIADKHKTSRDIFRKKLRELGFEKIQESVYVYPFECTQEITQLSYILGETKNILITISEIIQGENALIEKFFENNILRITDLN